MIDFALGFMVGFVIGLYVKPKDKDLVEQQRIYDEKVKEHEININYYRELCKWHVERANEQRQTQKEK